MAIAGVQDQIDLGLDTVFAGLIKRALVQQFDETPRGSHELLVQAFLASVPQKRRARTERRYPVLEERELREVLEQESPWAPDELDQALVSGGPVHRAEIRDQHGLEQLLSEEG